MLGWWIVISSQTPQELDHEVDKSAILATWESSVGGKKWLDAFACGCEYRSKSSHSKAS